MSFMTSYGRSFGPEPLAPAPISARQKSDVLAHAEAQRLAALDPKVQAWSDRLDLPDLEALHAVVRAYRSEGYAPVPIHVPTLARWLKTDERDTEARVERLVREGALERRRRLAQEPAFIPLTRASLPATKHERDLAEIRNVVADATARIEGKPVPQRAAKQESSFKPGTVMGLRRKD